MDITLVSYWLLQQNRCFLDVTSFKSSNFKLSIHVFLMSFEASIHGDSGFIYISVKR